MTKTGFALSLLVAFMLGCVATSSFVVPPAHAQNVQRWEYFCPTVSRHVQDALNKAGAEGWELVSADGNQYCLKRPR